MHNAGTKLPWCGADFANIAKSMTRGPVCFSDYPCFVAVIKNIRINGGDVLASSQTYAVSQFG
jgi:hypothetical protein